MAQFFNPKVIVGIPAFNEQDKIADVVRGALPHAAAVVVVDDGSRDRTAWNALNAGAKVIRHRHNGGKGAAVATLFRYAVEQGADALVLIDGGERHELRAGDCLGFGPPAEVTFANESAAPCTYVVALARS